jgi:hypothetical protein
MRRRGDPNDIFLIKTETDLMISRHTKFGSGEEANAKHQSAGAPVLQPQRVSKARAKKFAWIRYNPLKSPDSDEQNQTKPSYFPWISLVLLALIWRKSRAGLYSASADPLLR